MACKVNWTNRAWKTYEANIEYLLEQWTPKAVSDFATLVDNDQVNQPVYAINEYIKN